MRFCIERLEQERVLGILKETDGLFDPPFSAAVDLEQYSAKLASKAYFGLAYSDGGGLAGVVAFYLNDAVKQIYTPFVCVYLQFRHQHVASSLMDYIIKSNKGYTSMALEVLKTNTAALALYNRMNFKVVEEREHNYLLRLDIK